MKSCKYCGTEKPISEYYAAKQNADRKSHICKLCSHEANRMWRAKNKDRAKLWQKFNRIKNLYGLEADDYSSRLEAQGGVCAICGETGDAKGIVVDHCHDTGRVRGLICSPCNKGLGFFGDSTERLWKAIEYLAEQAKALRLGD